MHQNKVTESHQDPDTEKDTQVAVRTGGKEEKQQEAIDMEEDGGREGRQVETRVKMTAVRDCGREETISTLTLALTAMMEEPRTRGVLKCSPEVDRTTTEGDTGRLRDGRSLLHQEHNSTPNREERRGGLEGRI